MIVPWPSLGKEYQGGSTKGHDGATLCRAVRTMLYNKDVSWHVLTVSQCFGYRASLGFPSTMVLL